MKMHKVMPIENSFDFSVVDSIVQHTQDYDQRLFGHNLIWHSSTPKWVKNKAKKNPEWLASFMREYIHEYVGRYRGKVHGWDVVNEGLKTAGSGYRTDSIWYEALGPQYIEMAFRYAHEADPDAILFYNDFNLERDLDKFESMMSIVTDFQSREVPISGIGFQMHIRMDIPNSIIAETLKRAADTGLQIHLSEVDIIFNTHDDSRGGGIQRFDTLTPEMRVAQKKKYYDLVTIYNSEMDIIREGRAKTMADGFERNCVVDSQYLGNNSYSYDEDGYGMAWTKVHFSLKEEPVRIEINGQILTF